MKGFVNRYLVLTLIACNSMASAQSEKSFPEDPYKFEIIDSDIDLFWNAFDLFIRDTTQNPFKEEYIDKGSTGLKDYVFLRIENANALKSLVANEIDYYQKIREQTYQYDGYIEQIRASNYALKYWYPNAVFPPLFLVIGRTTGIGTASKNGLIIGMETLSEKPLKTSYGRPTFEMSLLPSVVAHEIIHFLQRKDDENKSLLKATILEGSADFIAELTSGANVKLCNGPEVYSYGDANEELLWTEFKEVMHKEHMGSWLYAQTTDGRPQNLGYWMGYKITEAYFNNAQDKHIAISEILNIKDFNKFLEDSGYPDKFK